MCHELRGNGSVRSRLSGSVAVSDGEASPKDYKTFAPSVLSVSVPLHPRNLTWGRSLS